MRIFTKSRYVFLPPAGVNDKAVHTPLKFFVDVPDWVKKDNLFQLGVKAGDIEVINSREKQLKVEAEATVQPVSPFASVPPFDAAEYIEPKAVPKVVTKVAPKTVREAEDVETMNTHENQLKAKAEVSGNPRANVAAVVSDAPDVHAMYVAPDAPIMPVTPKAVPKIVGRPVLKQGTKQVKK